MQENTGKRDDYAITALPRNYPANRMAIRRAVMFRKQRGRCFYCGDQMQLVRSPRANDEATVEHLVPRSMGGTDHHTNLVAACRFCNEVAERIERWCWKTFFPTYGRRSA